MSQVQEVRSENVDDIDSRLITVENQNIDDLLPDQTGNNGKILSTNGTTASWTTSPGAITWVRFNGASQSDLSGTYSRTGTTVTVTATSHGLIVGNLVFLDFTSGTATDGAFTVTSVADPNTFTVTHGTSGTTSGNVTLKFKTILGSSSNVVRVSHSSASSGAFVINFNSSLAHANYSATGTSNNSAGETATNVCEIDNQFPPTTEYLCVDSMFVNSAQNRTQSNPTIVCWTIIL